MQTQERKEANRRGASFSREEIGLAVDALRVAPPAESKELRDAQYRLLQKFRRMQESFE